MPTLPLNPFPDSLQFPFEIDIRMVDPNGDLRRIVVQGGQVVPKAAINDKPGGIDQVADMLADTAADAMRAAVKQIWGQPVIAQTARVVVEDQA